MTEPQQENKNRGVAQRILKESGITLDDVEVVRFQTADGWVDEALEALDDEEPSLKRWLSEASELGDVTFATKSAMYWALIYGLKNQKQPIEIINMFEAVIGRLMAASAWHAAMRERKSVSENPA